MTDMTNDPVADGKGEERRVFLVQVGSGFLDRVFHHEEDAQDYIGPDVAQGFSVATFVELREPTAREKLGEWLSEYAFRKWGLWEMSGPPESRFTVELYSGPKCVASVSAGTEDSAIESALRKCGAE